MKEAVIVSTARTPIGKAYRGAFNNLTGATLGSIPLAAAVSRAGIEPAEVEDCCVWLWPAAGHHWDEYCPADCTARRVASDGARHDIGSPVFVGFDGHCHRGKRDCG